MYVNVAIHSNVLYWMKETLKISRQFPIGNWLLACNQIGIDSHSVDLLTKKDFWFTESVIFQSMMVTDWELLREVNLSRGSPFIYSSLEIEKLRKARHRLGHNGYSLSRWDLFQV